MECDAEITFKLGGCYQLQEFNVGDQGFNFRFLGSGGDNQYVNSEQEYALIYARGGEIDLVKNFLLTIRDDIPS